MMAWFAPGKSFRAIESDIDHNQDATSPEGHCAA